MFDWLKSLFHSQPIACPGVAPEWTMTPHVSHIIMEGFFVVFEMGGKIRLRVEGMMLVHPHKPVDVFIANPPSSLRKHKHGGCFQLYLPGSKWLKLHWQKPAWKPEAAIACVEGILAECV